MSALESPDARQVEWRWALIGVVTMASLLCAQLVVGFLRESEPSYLQRVQTCLTERSTPFEEVSGDPVSLSAKRGALRTTVDGNSVTVALGDSEKDAERLYDAYAAVAPADVVATNLDRRRKVVFLWDSPPTTEQREFMILCTLDAQE